MTIISCLASWYLQTACNSNGVGSKGGGRLIYIQDSDTRYIRRESDKRLGLPNGLSKEAKEQKKTDTRMAKTPQLRGQPIRSTQVPKVGVPAALNTNEHARWCFLESFSTIAGS